MKQLIKIKSVNDSVMRIGLLLTRACTYQCSYCPEKLHTGNNKFFDLSSFKNFLEILNNNKQLILDITGGEPTIHPQFVELIDLCNQLEIKVSVGTNASRSRRWFEEHAHLVDNWVVTLHPSQHSLDIDKIKVISKNSFLVVCIMADPRFWEICLEWKNILNTIDNIKIVMLEVMNDWSGAVYKNFYTDQQLEFLKINNTVHTFTEEKITDIENLLSYFDRFNNTAIWDDGSETTVDPYYLIKHKQNFFKDWTCFAGNQVLSIDDDGIVYWGNCRAKVLGHYSQFKIGTNEGSIICSFDRCECSTDIRAKKSKF
jgi:MoaA/NifB/PqqE/SkfB family radical SAM enzyme